MVSEKMKEDAKSKDLYEYLLRNYPSDFKKVGEYIRPADKDRENVYIKKGCNFYYDFGGKHGLQKTNGYKNYGDNIDFLMNFYGLSFGEAVSDLLVDGGENVLIDHLPKTSEIEVPKEIHLPERFDGEPTRVRSYLTKTRGIPSDTVEWLLYKGLLYQDVQNNAVFVNYDQNCFEARGTYTYTDKPFKKVGFTLKDKCWFFGSGDTVYITESAIDAISLYILLGREEAYFASMHGTKNQRIIDRIAKAGKHHIVLAVDNDLAGQQCRERNSGLETLIPPSPYKDWNEMLVAGIPLQQ